MFIFEEKINIDYLKLAQIAYGGELYLNLKNYKLKEVLFDNSKIKKAVDSLLSKNGNSDFYSYKNEDSGFCANLFENIKTKELIIAYRGTERIGLGENVSDINALIKDFAADLNLLTGNFEKQFIDAWEFYKTVKKQNPKKKINIVGHSLGGALAQIVAAKEYTINKIKIKTYTYNAPGCTDFLDLYDCNTTYKYSFITNYSVMNDWCGMYGNHIGTRYLILPIPIKKIDTNVTSEILNNILLTTHEGIFEYSKELNGKIIKKPKDFNQNEGLSLWYYDDNNPINEYQNMSDFLGIDFAQLNIQNNSIKKKTEKFFKDNIPNELQNSNIAIAIKNTTDNLIETTSESFNNFINNNMAATAIKALDFIFSKLSSENLNKAKKILKTIKN